MTTEREIKTDKTPDDLAPSLVAEAAAAVGERVRDPATWEALAWETVQYAEEEFYIK